jgi:shikimate dehydrogenase
MTTLVGLLGFPVEHSRSPAMHNAAFQELGLDWRYEPIAVEPARFESVVRQLPELGFVGVNVTTPHKLRALEVADSASEVTRAIGAANTLSFAEGGISAHNTDAEGFRAALHEQAPDAPEGMRALVLGAGGAARAVVYALLRERVALVEVWNRHPERAHSLVAELAAHASGITLRVVPEPSAADADLIVNATSVGMATPPGADGIAHDLKELRISADSFHDDQVVVDLVYRGSATALVREARVRGLRYIDGIDILVHQGAASFKLWTGRDAPLGVMRREARKR